MSSNDQIARDLGRKISDQLEDVLQRELAIAHIMLQPADLAIMILKVASGLSIASVLVIVQLAREGVTRDDFFDITLTQLHALNTGAKQRGMTMLAEAETKKRGQ